MSAVGLAILIISSFAALSAPVLFPTNPRDTAGAHLAQPEWVTIFPEGYYLSKDIVVVPPSDSTFPTPASAQEWSLRVQDQTNLPATSLSYAPPGPGSPSGSLQVSSASLSANNVRVYRTFHYPYHGPPAQFLSSFMVRAEGVSASQPIQIRFFIDSPTKSFTLWSENITQPSTWTAPTYSLDSTGIDLADAMGLGEQNTGLSVAAVVFSSLGDYSLGFQAAFYGPGKINVTDLGLVLYGTTHGVLGTDFYGADLFSQNVYGSRISLLVGLTAAFIGIGVGLIVGLVAGYKTGLTDEVLMRFTDMMLVIPALPLLIVLIAVLGASIYNLILVIGFLGWMGFARIIRAQVLSLKERPFIEAAKAAGAGTTQILTRHVFPNIVSLTYVNLALTVPGAILAEAALSFLGLGDPSVLSWGQILNTAESTGTIKFFWIILPPGLAIAIVSVSFVLLGYALDEIFNPKLRRRR